ncbi:MAG: peptidylprolyl isomerase [Actinobacteria bacterium]|nr:peptidylprolyl isomerase [Actinomycetota bacterium]
MGTEKRERQKANRAAKLAAEEAAEARTKRIRFIRNVAILLVCLVVVLFLLAGCGSSSDATADADGYGSTPCPPEGGVEEPQTSFDDSFALCIDPTATYTAVFTTTMGDVTVELDAADHPITTNNFVALARSGYYDGTKFFRTEAPTGIIQGGSPTTQSNTDPGPGYTIPDEGPAATSDDYGPGTLAMARTSAPDSAGGQFFFLAGEGGRYLGDPNQLGDDAGSYRVFGTVTDGLDVLVQIAALDRGDSVPSSDVSIESITITES